jgi:hypothetical protein
MIGFDSIFGFAVISGKQVPAGAAGGVAQVLGSLVLTLLLIASFRNRLYWGRAR